MKFSYTLILSMFLLSPSVFSEGKKNHIEVAKSSTIKSSRHIQVHTKITIEGMKYDKMTGKFLFGKKMSQKMSPFLCLSGDIGMVSDLIEFESELEDKLFEGIKIKIKPTIDFIQGRIYNAGRIVASLPDESSPAKIINKHDLKFNRSFRSWSHSWSGKGNQSLNFMVDDHPVTLKLDFSVIDAKGKKVTLTKVNPKINTNVIQSKIPQGAIKLDLDSEIEEFKGYSGVGELPK